MYQNNGIMYNSVGTKNFVREEYILEKINNMLI